MCLGFTFCFYRKHDYLKNVQYHNTEPFVVPIDSGKVVKVYDGDTITIASKLPNSDGPIYRFQVRLSGIDSAEIKGKCEDEKEIAKIARHALSERIMGKIVHLKNVSSEKYGRILADVYCENKNMCDWMIENKYAVKYDGGTKIRPKEWG
jgi:endonuclease YncB( thermonuclease family)